MTDQNNKKLSPEGVARKEAMLSLLVGQMKHIHNARKMRRRVIHTLTLVVICAFTVWIISIQYLSPQPIDIAKGPTGPGTYIEQPNAPLIKTINDDELIALLAEMDRPTGIIRSEGRIWLTNAVTDEELGISQDTPDEDPSSM